jgi:hypothetical protein
LTGQFNHLRPRFRIAFAAAILLVGGNLQSWVHTFVRQIEADIRAFIDRHNQNSADQVFASVKRFCHKRSRHYAEL